MSLYRTAPAAAVERGRTRQIARIGNNLNQIVRWANTYASAAEVVEVVAHLVGIERAHYTGGDLRSIWESSKDSSSFHGMLARS